MFKEQKINNQIRAKQVFLIDAEGANRGLVATHFAQRLATESALDLVEVSAREGMPVCKIIDYGKLKYAESKAKKPSPKVVVKEIKLTPRIDKHDIEIKVKQVHKWLEQGCKVQVSVVFKGRENAHKELGFSILENFKLEGFILTPPKLEGTRIMMELGK